MKTINFYSYKGGVGRTMLTAQIARLLAALGKKVVVVDFDFDAPGIPAVFGIPTGEVKCGLFELAKMFTRESTFEAEKEFKRSLVKRLKDEEYLIDISIKLRGEPNPETGVGAGCIQILPCGRVDFGYFDELYAHDWMDFLVEPPDERRSFTRFFKDFLQPALEKMGFEYLLIDSRAGITQYGRIARHVADRQVVIFCPNDEAKYALKNFLLPELVEGQENTQTNKLEKIIFVVSRIPPELPKKTEAVFKEMEDLIIDELHDSVRTCMEVLRLHADLETQLDQWIRIIDASIVLDTVQMIEDILVILAKLCHEAVPNAVSNVGTPDIDDQVVNVWMAIFKEEFRIIYKNRVFGFSAVRGEMRNPDDDERNVSFKVETFLKFLNQFYRGFFKISQTEANNMMYRVLYEAGYTCGLAFGAELARMDDFIPAGIKIEDREKNIEEWCKFDTNAGFGRMTYKEKVLKVEHLFLLDASITLKRDYTPFFTGYVIGVLETLLDPFTLKSLEMARIGEKDEDSVNYKLVYSEDRKEVDFTLDTLTSKDIGVLYRIEV